MSTTRSDNAKRAQQPKKIVPKQQIRVTTISKLNGRTAARN